MTTTVAAATTISLPSTVTTTAIPQPSTGTKTVSMIILFPVQCLQSIQTKEIIIQILVSPLLWPTIVQHWPIPSKNISGSNLS